MLSDTLLSIMASISVNPNSSFGILGRLEWEVGWELVLDGTGVVVVAVRYPDESDITDSMDGCCWRWVAVACALAAVGVTERDLLVISLDADVGVGDL